MFSKQKKPKIDPRIRFQNRQFNQKLQKARTYQRTVRTIPEGSFGKFLTNIGLGSRLRQAVVLLIVAAVVYIVYIPNFLSWQNIQIDGMSDVDSAAVKASIQDNLSHVKFYNPQKNILFLSKRRLSEAIMQVAAVNKINVIDKEFKTHSIKISITSKYSRFLVRSANGVYDVYNDGSTKGPAGVNLDAWESVQNPAMIKVATDGKITNPDDKVFLTPNSVQYIEAFQSEAKGIVGSSLAYVKVPIPEFRQPVPPDQPTDAANANNSNSNGEKKSNDNTNANMNSSENKNTAIVSANNSNANTSGDDTADLPEPVSLNVDQEVQLPLNADELEIFMQKGNDPHKLFRVIIDTSESAHDVVQRLNFLLSQTAPDRYNLLSYIDLRIKTRAFECLTNAPCNK